MLCSGLKAQMPSKVLVGYWENWSDLRIKDLDPRYNVIMLAFLEADTDYPARPDNNVVSDLEFTANASQVKADIATVQAKGKKVLVSIGGANGSFKLNNVSEKNTFVTKVKDFISAYQVDGIDIDIERTVYSCMTTGSLTNAENHHQLLIDGVKELLVWYQSTFGKKMLLTTAPETLYVQGGLSQWAECGGSFLAFIEQLRDDLDLVMVQLYNSGRMFDLDKVERSQGSQAFVVSMTEAVIRGFQTQSFGYFSGIDASKVAVALPACGGEGYVAPDELVSAVKYLMGTGPKVGNYTLKNTVGYGNLAGLMTWSINSDESSACGRYSFADASERILGPIGVAALPTTNSFTVFPNPASSVIEIEGLGLDFTLLKICDYTGKVLLEKQVSTSNSQVDVSGLSSGIYAVLVGNKLVKMVKQ